MRCAAANGAPEKQRLLKTFFGLQADRHAVSHARMFRTLATEVYLPWLEALDTLLNYYRSRELMARVMKTSRQLGTFK